MPDTEQDLGGLRVWRVGALCRAIGLALDNAFNPITVSGEVSGFVQATSGHCYFSLKDAEGQIRCAMFRRSAGLLNFVPREGEQVQARGRLGVYEPRGDLQLIVESLSQAGEGVLFEQFLRLKAKLEAEGLFAASRKLALPTMPKSVGVVTSLGAAALHDVITAARRRIGHISLVIAPAAVQGAGAAQAMVEALRALAGDAGQGAGVDLILLVRGGGSLEDLWAFNDEALARAIADSPIPVVTGIGHETDFTLADFAAALRAPTPTAALELCAPAWAELDDALWRFASRLCQGGAKLLERRGQALDGLEARIARPSVPLIRHRLLLAQRSQHWRNIANTALRRNQEQLQRIEARLTGAARQVAAKASDQLARLAVHLEAMGPQQVQRRGFVWVSDPLGAPVTTAKNLATGTRLSLHFADGVAEAKVQKVSVNAR